MRRRANSSIQATTRSLKLLELKISKDKKLVFSETMVEDINNGKFCIFQRLPRLRPRDSMKNSVGISTDHSTLSLSFQ
jgi:hypothetical protein